VSFAALGPQKAPLGGQVVIKEASESGRPTDCLREFSSCREVSQTRLLQVGFLSICVNCAFGLSKHRERMSEMETLVPSSDQRLISSSHGSPYSIALGRCFVLESAFPQV
jgi:hypothetical protein